MCGEFQKANFVIQAIPHLSLWMFVWSYAQKYNLHLASNSSAFSLFLMLWDRPEPCISRKKREMRFSTGLISQLFMCLVAQSCPTLCDPMDCNLPGSSVHGDSPGKNAGVDCHSLLQRIFLTQRLNPVSCIAGGMLCKSNSFEYPTWLTFFGHSFAFYRGFFPVL